MRFFKWLFFLTVAGVVSVVMGSLGLLYYYGSGLPDYRSLKNYHPPVVSRIYANDGSLFAEYAHEKRIYVPHAVIPQRVKLAFLAAEDKNFYTHFGIDLISIAHAAVKNVQRVGAGLRPIGASTITQQVAKNFLLSDDSAKVSIERKIKEAILSFRIERTFAKEYILELYLNEVFLGNRSYGVAAAALNYFNKSLDELTVAEAAYLAALPKAPSRYNPVKRRKITYARRNWVVGQMYQNGFITLEEALEAKRSEIIFRQRETSHAVEGNYFAEEVRRELVRSFGDRSVYQDGYVVRTSMDPRLQTLAEHVLQRGLEAYDRRHGWRGPLLTLSLPSGAEKGVLETEMWLEPLRKIATPAGALDRPLGVVVDVTAQALRIGLKDGSSGTIPLKNLRWARRFISDRERGAEIRHPKQVAQRGDVVLVKPEFLASGQPKMHAGQAVYKLCQIPEVSGAIVALEPRTGRVLAMQGGYSFKISQFNRATQALRQTGSAFKPFVYLAGLEAGLTPSTMLEDAPFAIDVGFDQGIWRPDNWDKRFQGAIPLLKSFAGSRNVAAIRMIHECVGMNGVVDVARRFNIDKSMPAQLSGVLGASETTVLRLCAAYAMLANGGKLVVPTVFDHIQDRRGKTVLVNNYTICENCHMASPNITPELRDLRPFVTQPLSAFQMTMLLRAVVERGTGRMLKGLPHRLAVKSGTTNDYRDAWMVGYTPSLVVAVYVGFDTPRSLGDKHYGAKVAGPIFKEFVEEALSDVPLQEFVAPEEAKLAHVDPTTGLRVATDAPYGLLQAYTADTLPPYHSDKAVASPQQVMHGQPLSAPESDAEEYPTEPGRGNERRALEAPRYADKPAHLSDTPPASTHKNNVVGTGGFY